ncbi:MAG: elongation factor G, partial [Dehalococcoidia bacterium]|nr:elongation factor G [Dehalococcoidia bacterium]
YGHVMLEFDPLPRGSGFEFGDKVVGGRVPKNYIPAVEKGVMDARKEGVLAKYPVVDVKVTLYDGSFHPVDSSEICFKIAGSQAFKKGIAEGKPVLLEPVMQLEVIVPDEFTGDIVSDLNSKRGRMQGMNSQGGIQTIAAHVPLSEAQRYAIDLRSITQGRGTFTMEFSHYEEMPPQIAQKVIQEKSSVEKEK